MIKEKINKALRISYLLASSFVSDLNENDRVELDLWLNKKDENSKLRNEILDQNAFEQRAQQIDRIDMPKEWNRFQTQIKPVTVSLQNRLTQILKYAAVIVLPIGIALFILLNHESYVPQLANLPIEIAPGVKKAQLVLSTGERFELSDSTLNISNKQEGVEIKNQDSRLNYSATDGQLTQKAKYNTLIVGRGEEYQLALADGTQVWLNSESSLRYPVKFTGKNRRVELSGEAYFEVTHNAKKPFIVNTQEMNIEVLGTSFNVSAYADDATVHATLVEGKVRVHNNVGVVKKEILRPNQQFVFSKNDNSTRVNEVNASFYSAWKNGVFTFEDESLTSIMRKMERWYDIHVFFQGQDIQRLKFSGKIPKFNTCNDVLEMIGKTTHINFKVSKNKNVIIRMAKKEE
ncbi:FecR family protein [Ancylomarina sp. 16SWW S1-10-2]|uniref:FecR family protein n=1 Tax=Ancylomarina sp. 16SWW S1-10-2 TaxID=2499681 RepID=UPI0012AD8BC6|nr:FecR family protein [Ancylomarina sp. 16SWW S1-10-2]MRT93721.1 FecR family protein [Ancylomarina sp. 16SWW S1-10-2]